MITFVSLHSGTSYAFVGDLVWQLEGITLREERALDHPQFGFRMLRARAKRAPFAEMPMLSQASSEAGHWRPRHINEDTETTSPVDQPLTCTNRRVSNGGSKLSDSDSPRGDPI